MTEINSFSDVHAQHKKAETDFKRFDPILQTRIKSEADGVGEQTAAHTIQVLIGPPAKAVSSIEETEKCVHTASAVSLYWNGRTYLVTAAHVLEWYFKKKKEIPSLIFQASNAVLDPAQQLVHYDELTDIALLEITEVQKKSVASLVYLPREWPPKLIAGDYVSFGGFPKELRVISGPGAIELSFLGALLEVETVSSSRVVCVIPRERVVLTRGDAIPSPDAEVGGMSGGPVFKANFGQPITLVGVITDYGPMLDVYYFAPIPMDLDSMPRPGSIKPPLG